MRKTDCLTLYVTKRVLTYNPEKMKEGTKTIVSLAIYAMVILGALCARVWLSANGYIDIIDFISKNIK